MLDEPLQELREAPLFEAFPQVRRWARLGSNQRPRDYESSRARDAVKPIYAGQHDVSRPSAVRRFPPRFVVAVTKR